MSYDFHHNKDLYFEHQYLNSKYHIVPYLQAHMQILPTHKVLEIGCAEGGVLKAFTDLGCECQGIELSSSKVLSAHKYMSDEIKNGLFHIQCKDIYEVDSFSESFDIILLKDTIEHIHDQERLLLLLKSFLKPGGLVFLGFPSWYMPWGGHQQICDSKVLMHMPFMHLLPTPAYSSILRLFGEKTQKINDLMEIKETGISSMRLEKIASNLDYNLVDRTIFFINPIYTYKFKIKPWKQPRWLMRIPMLRDCLSTTCFYLLETGV